MDADALIHARHRNALRADGEFPFAIPRLRHNEAHRIIRRRMERGGEVHATEDGFIWKDEGPLAEATVEVRSATDGTVVTAFVERAREMLACRIGTPFGLAAAAVYATGSVVFDPMIQAGAAVVALVAGVPAGIALDRWLANRWKHRVFNTVDDLNVLASAD